MPNRSRDVATAGEALRELPSAVDVVVIGGGNAGLCAAIVAREHGATVLLVEAAPRHFRGGNSRHTRDVRYMHTRLSPYVTGTYVEDEFWDDLRRVTGGETNQVLARLTIRSSENFVEWLSERGVEWQPPLRGTLHLARTNVFMLGGGTAMMNAEYATGLRLGVQVAYEAAAEDLTFDGDRCTSISVRFGGGLRSVKAGALVVACGGFEANLEWLKEYWGAAADNFVIRGTPYNQGRMLRVLLDNGARAIGNPREFHAVAVDARAPKFDGGIVTRLDSVPFGIAVNRDGKRFYDEGEDFWPKRYAIWGGLIARQRDQIAYSIVDAKVLECFMPSVFAPVTAGTLRDLADQFNLDATSLETTVADYNQAVRPGRFDPARLDDCRTEGLAPDKSHWAQPLDTPPYYGYPLRPGITFTYHGVEVNDCARVLREDGRLFDNVFAAGEMMAGNILGRGYLAGFGLTIGTVFGRIAGREAARHARL